MRSLNLSKHLSRNRRFAYDFEHWRKDLRVPFILRPLSWLKRSINVRVTSTILAETKKLNSSILHFWTRSSVR